MQRTRGGSPRPGKSTGERLLSWYKRHGRDLPWRTKSNPYHVWVSEIMLQQTTVPVVVPYFVRFVERFPDVESLAHATEEEVLSLWSGLGYYRRARHLLSAARVIAERYGGQVPDDQAALRRLPGVGAYTAGAIMSIGHNRACAALDGNIMRVMARVGGIEGTPSRAATRKAVEALVLELMPQERASAFNQALMDLGSMICTPRVPLCESCPIHVDCDARRRGIVDRIPPVAKPDGPVVVDMAAVAVLRTRRARDGVTRCLLVQRDGGLMNGLWEFPLTPLTSGTVGPEVMARHLGARLAGSVGRFRHTITRHRMSVTVFQAAPGHRARRDAAPSWDLSEPSTRLATVSGGKVTTMWADLGEVASGSSSVPLTAIGRKVAMLLKKEMT
jgi:A/G-specific adenine glycosylase